MQEHYANNRIISTKRAVCKNIMLIIELLHKESCVQEHYANSRIISTKRAVCKNIMLIIELLAQRELCARTLC
jgi:hypothetical protein